MNYYIDCFQCGQLSKNYRTYGEAITARNEHEEKYEHIATVESSCCTKETK